MSKLPNFHCCCTSKDRPPLADVFAVLPCPPDLVVADAQVVSRDPHCRPPRPQGVVLKGVPRQRVSLLRRQVLDVVGNPAVERVPYGALGLEVPLTLPPPVLHRPRVVAPVLELPKLVASVLGQGAHLLDDVASLCRVPHVGALQARPLLVGVFAKARPVLELAILGVVRPQLVPRRAEPEVLRPLEGLVPEHGLVLERYGQVSEERRKRHVERPLVEHRQEAHDDHDDAPGHQQFHKVQAGKSLVDGPRVEDAAGVGLEPVDVNHGIPLSNPEETKGDDDEDGDERCRDAVDEADAGKTGKRLSHSTCLRVVFRDHLLRGVLSKIGAMTNHMKSGATCSSVAALVDSPCSIM
ncbi:hypothetical protein L249_3791 [Ophiocordyceps polyrhachis-furcata BCC 54312]|uniref:Uncharacterized protein n=1 Tax=Ophiocordyceps polyrhachis-furcata BCC 54312 TaxID=1330021 RepID=A0A367L500_9HYPO|nr:hypothetical protein L249_3791 [Ophiocordyceps polyrhachis-furcata BCC 54312]